MKVKDVEKDKDGYRVKAKTTTSHKQTAESFKWWNASSKEELKNQVLSTVELLKTQQTFRTRQASIFSRLYGNIPLTGINGNTGLSRIQTSSSLPIDRPTMSVITSCVDTLVSRLTQHRPRPVFLTDGGNYKERKLAKELNAFIMGEFFRTKTYGIAEYILRDAAVLGTGCLKIFEQDNKVQLDRVLCTELLVDPNEALYSQPRQLHQLKLVDRGVLAEAFPGFRESIEKAEQGFPDLSGDSLRTVSDQIIVAESWHLPSSATAGDGLHVVTCSTGVIFEEKWEKDNFPFVFMDYAKRMVGFWGQGLAERQMGTQMEINKLLSTISQAINLVGVPRVFVEDGSKVVKSHLTNQVGAVVTYRGTKPQYEVAPCVPGELYSQLQRLIAYAYEQEGISSLAATSQKPKGLNSGEAIRSYDDILEGRFSALSKRYNNFFVDLAYQITYKAKEIAEREGEYTTVYSDKNGSRKVDLPKMGILDDDFVIQCFDASSLPRDPAGRLSKVAEMAQAGMISMPEARRLLDFPDLEQVQKLANAPEERILQILDEIIDEGKYTPPDPFMDLSLANQLTVQYYNLYGSAKLEESKMELLRDFHTQIQQLVMASQPVAPEQLAPQALPEALPTSPLIPNSPQ